MATASIRSIVPSKPTKTDESRDDLAISDVVEVRSVNAGLQYAWSIAFKPEGSTAVFSSTGTEQAVTQNPGTFTVDKDGPYLIRLQFTDATGTTEQYVRLRAETAFGDLKLVAAGERYDTLRIPVDATPAGWADEQNYNLNTLLALVKSSATEGNVLYVDAAGGGDYTTVQAAIDAAQAQTPTFATPWAILVRPGTYPEDLTFYPFVNVLGWPGGSGPHLVSIQAASVAGHTFTPAAANHTLLLADLELAQPNASSPVLTQSGTGRLYGFRLNMGGGFSFSNTTAIFTESTLVGNGIAPGDFVITAGSSTDLTLKRCVLEHDHSGISTDVGGLLDIDDCQINTAGTTSISTKSEETSITFSEVAGPILANDGGGGVPADLAVGINYSKVNAVTVDGNAVPGVASLNIGVSTHGALSVVNGALQTANTPADTVFYDNALFPHGTPLTASNVQDALDEIYDYAAKVRTLDDAYDGGIPNTGVGRTIVADQGAVQIVDVPGGSVPIPPGNTSGSLEVVGPIKVGAILDPEMTLDPNLWGNGPMIKMGYDIWANDAPQGSTAMVLGDAVGAHNYNLRLGTTSAAAGLRVGSLSLRGGDSLAPIEAGHIFVQAGTATHNGGGDGGSIFIAPGDSLAGTRGTIKIVDPTTATAATLTAGQAFTGGVTGNITFGSELGGFTIAVDAADAVGDVHAKFDATGIVTAAGDPIVLTTVAKGPQAEVFYLNADAGVDTALGGFTLSAIPAPVFVAGTWPSQMAVALTGTNEITFGVGDPNPMLYDSNLGKLTVPGLIDPTGMIFDEAPQPATGAGKGALFVGDGSGGTVANRLYYADQTGTLVDLSTGGGGGGTLQDAYNAGNIITTSGGADIDFNISPVGNFRVDGNGFVQFGALTPIEQFDLRTNTAIGVTAGTTLNINSVSDATLEVIANEASSRAVTIKAQNSVGDANVVVEADNQVTITAQGDATFDVDADVVADKTLLIRATNAKSGLGGSANVTIESEKVSIITEDLDVSPGAVGVPASVKLKRYTSGANSLIHHQTSDGTPAQPVIAQWESGLQSGGADYTLHDITGERFRIDTNGVITVNAVGGSPFSLPNADGVANQVLQTDGSGSVTWATVASGGGDVTGPASSTVDGGTQFAIARYADTTGKVLQDSASATISNTGRIECGQVETTSSLIATTSVNAGESVNAGTYVEATTYLKGATLHVDVTGAVAGHVLTCSDATIGEATWAAPASGDVTGPASATVTGGVGVERYAIARYADTSGKVLQNSAFATINDAGRLDCDQVFTVGSINSGDSINASTTISAIDQITSTSGYLKAPTVRVTEHATGGPVQLGDVLVCTDASTGEAKWGAAPAGGGDVTGPASATDTALARFDGTTGKLLQNSNATLTTAGDLTLAGSLTVDPPAAGTDAFGIFDRVDTSSSSATIYMTGAGPDWITGTTATSSDYTIADGGGTERLRVTPTGDVRINNVFTLPNVDGLSNQVLRTDGGGNVTWATVAGVGGWPTSTGTDGAGIPYEAATLGAANAYIVLEPGSAGPIQTAISDSAASGGDNRGLYATDWQRFRTAAPAVASGSYSTLSGGRQNMASSTDATVSGGQANQASGDQSAVGGGFENFAQAIATTVGGGYQNQIGVAATYATIIGGRENSTLSEGSVCMGIRSRTFTSGQMVHASGSFNGTSDGSAQHGRMVLRATTNASAVELNSNAGLKAVTTSDYLTLDNKTGHFFTLHVVARATAPGENAWWSVQGCIIKDNNNASTTLIGPAPPSVPIGSAGTFAGGWLLNVTADTANGRLKIEGDSSGYAGDVRWVATLQTTQVAV